MWVPTKTQLLCAASGTVGVVIGVAASYKTLQMRLKAVYGAQYEKETFEMKAYYKHQNMLVQEKAASIQERANLIQELLNEKVKESLGRSLTDGELTDVNEALPADVDILTLESPEEVSKIITAHESDDVVYEIIAMEDYMLNPLDNTQATWTYYEGDDVMVDGAEMPVSDFLDIVGDTLGHFGHLSNDPNIVYVRNNEEDLEIEIIRDRGSYSDDHIEHSDKPRVRKFRRDD